MTWATLKNRRAGLPLLLAGPILRRVTETSVSVWYAAKAWRTCQLKILDEFGTVLFQSNPVDPIALGSFLTVGCVTARAGAGQRLQPGVRYHYDLDFGDADLAAALVSSAYSVNLLYGTDPLPSFELPATDIAQLRLATGSCRKPHSDGRDALEALDQAITGAGSNAPRPQLLVLSGDQIYADDVADALLHCLRDTVMTLMDDWDEDVPGLGAVSALKPGHRSAAARSLGFTAMVPGKPEYAKSHLLAFGEYLAMYLLAWSDVLWPQHLPTFQEATGDNEWINIVGPSGGATVRAPGAGRFASEARALIRFRDTLPKVRRALANTPTYMAWDDHEITDDWYISRHWCESTLGNDGGRRVIANGLAAATLCQVWGNDPDQFDGASGNGRTLLNGISSWAVAKNSGNHAPVAAGVLPPSGGLMVPVTGAAGHRMLAQPAKPITWHFAVDFARFRLVGLDTRTRRQYPGLDDPPLLIEREALRAQLGNALPQLTVVVLPAPLVGFRGIERVQRSQVTRNDRLDFDCEAPGLQPAFAERFLAELAMRAPDDPNQTGMRYASVLLLSGDVHFGYMATLAYEATAPFDQNVSRPPVRMTVVQLTASALRNEGRDFALTFTGNSEDQFLGIPLPQVGNAAPVTTYGYGTVGTARSTVNQAFAAWLQGNPGQIFPRPLVEALNGTGEARVDVSSAPPPVRAQLAAPAWRHELRFLRDSRSAFARGPQGVLFGSEAVGHNNLGDVRFVGPDLQFDLWWEPTGGSQLITGTRFRSPVRIDALPDPLAVLRTDLAAEASAQLLRWRRADSSIILESDPAGQTILSTDYWPPILGRAPSAWFAAPDWWNVAWSAAFVIYCANVVSGRAGFGDMLESDRMHPEHMYYTWQAYRDRTAATAPRFWAHDVGVAVEVGDIVVKSRGTVDATWAEVQSTTYIDRDTHGDIVVDVQGTTATVIGGNVGNSVREGTYTLINGMIDTTLATNDADRVFAILKPTLP